MLNYLGFGLPAWESVAAVRFHHQWQPKVRVAPNAVSCRTQMTVREGDTLKAVADPRDWGYSIAR